MPNLTFAVEGAAPIPFAAAPTLAFKLRIANADPAEQIQNVLLACQIQIESTRRRYAPKEKERLLDLFGEPERWTHTLRAMLWTHASAVVPPFEGEIVADLLVPCTFDFNVAATKYFDGLEEGEVPLNLLFSGTVFYADEEGALRATRIPWTKEARYRLPIAVWKEMIELYYPKRAWLCLERGAFDRLHDYKRRRGIPTWEQAIEQLVTQAIGPPAPETATIAVEPREEGEEATQIEARTTVAATRTGAAP